MSIPTKANPVGVYTYHNTLDGISLAVELEKGGTVTGALAICSPRDNFSKKKARMILQRRLAKKRFTSDPPRTFRLGTYEGDSFKTDVFEPLMDYVRDYAFNFFLRKGELGNQNELITQLVGRLVKEVERQQQEPLVTA